jgi:hypothetical protein
MSTIIAGHFQLQEELDLARQELVRAGFPEQRISGFFVNQPGQHDMTPIGGDHQISSGAKETPQGVAQGAAAGGAVGVAVGAATTPLTGPLGAIVGGLVGAHVGSLFSFSKMKEKGEHEDGGDNSDRVRRSGLLLAVSLEPGREGGQGGEEQLAVQTLQRVGAHHIERAQGTIAAGDWVDFDPLSEPSLLTH